MNQKEHLRLLDLVLRTALLGYPYQDPVNVDPRVLIALGKIACIASEAIQEVTGQQPTLGE